jgi:hypothetical protein
MAQLEPAGTGGSKGVMKRGRFAALAGLSTVVVLAGWVVGVVGFGSPEARDADADLPAAAAKGPYLGAARTAASQVDSPAAPVAAAAVLDSSLFVPRPTLAPGDPGLRIAALSTPDPIENVPDAPTSSVEPAPAVPAVKKPIVVPKLDHEIGFTLAQIGEIKTSMNLRPDQQQYWPQVEAVLRDLARQFAAQKAAGKKVAIGASDAQRLYWAAGPLIMSMTDDQKQDIRRIARAMGLAQIASLL